MRSRHLPHRVSDPFRSWRVCLVAGVAVVVLGCGGAGATPADGGAAGTSAAGTSGSPAAGDTGSAGTNAAPLAGTVLAQGEYLPASIAIDDTQVYFVTVSEIRRVPKAGGAATTLYVPPDFPYELQVDDTHLYWMERTCAKNVVRAPKGGGGQRQILASLAYGGVVVDATSAYWLSPDVDNKTTLNRMPKAGGVAPTKLVTQIALGNPALDDQYVYWGEGTIPTVQRIAKTGGAIQDVTTELNSADMALPDATHVYFVATYVGVNPIHLMKAPKTGGPPTMLSSDLELPKHIALGDDAVYIMVSNESPTTLGYIAKVPKAGGPMVKLVTDTLNPGAMVVDSQFVYWTEVGKDDGTRQGRVRKIAR